MTREGYVKMGKELFRDIGDMLGVNCFRWDENIDRRCDFCEFIKKGCHNLEVISVSAPGNRREVTMCKECFKIMWPPPKETK
jgi:hypothetical protein